MEPLGTILARKATENKSEPYLYFLDKEVSYEAINACANQMASVFAKLGVNKGTHVALILPNCPEYLYLLLVWLSQAWCSKCHHQQPI